jgi:hypothetical protein
VRPEFQKTAATQGGLDVEMEQEAAQAARTTRASWPPSLPERVRAVRDYLMQSGSAVPAATVARGFARARVPEVAAILETLAALGHANREGSAYRG